MEYIYNIDRGLSRLVFKTLKNDIVFTVSIVLAIASCLISPPRISYIDFKVLACLFNLMVVVKAFEELHVLDMFAVGILNKCTDSRKVSLILIVLSFFSSMLITNDIALITLVPLALIISKKSNINMLVTIVLQTLAANIGSSLTPMGNPQNLFIFAYYKLSAMQFFVPVILFSISGLVWLYVLNYRNHNTRLEVDLEAVMVKEKNMAAIWAVLFAVIILSVFGIVNYIFVFILTLAMTFAVNRQLLQKVDYPLLITFVCFFIFIGNLSNVPAISSYLETFLNSGTSTYFGSILLSQFISNVPCSIFLSRFTDHWRELLLGVNIGGMGTIIASMASVISYKLFIKENPEKAKKYLLSFTVYNFVSLGVFTVVNFFVMVN